MRLGKDPEELKEGFDDSTQLHDLDRSFTRHPLIADQQVLEEAAESRSVTPSRLPIPKVTEPDAKICRICFDTETSHASLMHPCRCAGSAKYIHEECLKAWLASRGADLSKTVCEVCKTPFLMKFKVHRIFSPKEVCKDGITQCLFTPLLLAVLGMLILIIYLLCNKYANDSNSSETKGYTIALIITCALASLVISFLIAHTVRDACFTRKMEEWHIYSQEFIDPVSHRNKTSVDPVLNNETPSNLIDQTIMQPVANPEIPGIELPPLLLIPRRLKLNGKKVTLPLILPPTMNMISAQGKMVAVTPKIHSSSLTPVHYSLVTEERQLSFYKTSNRRAVTPDLSLLYSRMDLQPVDGKQIKGNPEQLC